MEPAYAGYPLASVLVSATLLLWFVVEIGHALNRRPGATPSDRGSLWVVRLVAVAGALLAALALAKAPEAAFPFGSAVLVVSLVVMWAGIGLRLWCFRTLGRYFTFQVMTSTDQPVIATGPYRVLRHPSYAAIMLILSGIGLSYGNWLSFAALTLVPLIGFVYRIGIEEAALSSALGDRYTTFSASRKRLVPFVW